MNLILNIIWKLKYESFLNTTRIKFIDGSMDYVLYDNKKYYII